MEWNEIQATGRNVVFRPLREDERRSLLLRDSTATNDDEHDNHREEEPGTAATDRCYDATDVRHVRNELEQIRIQRFSKDAAGCSCRKFALPQQKHKQRNKG